ncbi:HAD family hydrolase [Puteibacter caeruleilacunae]|nr:HAD family hydrolase [Puteibacter caeruleilacunae]
MKKVKLVVFDMAGTTVKDENEVEDCFFAAVEETGLTATRERINSMMGWSKRLVFETLWKEQCPNVAEAELEEMIEKSYQKFKTVLENHYRTQPVLPTEGCLELFKSLSEQGIKIALTTGFYREVTNIILDRLGWDKGLDENYIGGEIIDASIASDEVASGRPSPFMIQKAMNLLNVESFDEVIKIGDTPSDLQAGKSAGCLLSLGVTNGTHTAEEMSKFENDGLIPSLAEFVPFVMKQEVEA